LALCHLRADDAISGGLNQRLMFFSSVTAEVTVSPNSSLVVVIKAEFSFFVYLTRPLDNRYRHLPLFSILLKDPYILVPLRCNCAKPEWPCVLSFKI